MWRVNKNTPLTHEVGGGPGIVSRGEARNNHKIQPIAAVKKATSSEVNVILELLGTVQRQ